MAGALPPGPPVDRFSDDDRFAELMRSAGLTSVRFAKISFTHALRDVDALWDLALGGFARVSTIIKAQDAGVRRRVREAVEDAAQRYASPRGLEIPVAFRVASGARPG